ncbi:MAG: ATP-binding protein, partial [Calditrichaeota bacterium]|nr:ATP-binding protein [Calditrichota bacterium]
EPLNFFESSQFLTRYGIKDKIRAYGMLGGIPAYLLQFDSRQTVEENILNNFLYTDSFLYNETRFLLLEELREPRKYFAILKAIAFGANKINEIVQKSGIERSSVPRYLEILQNLMIIHREVSVTEEKPEKSRKAIYEINDLYFKFWFRFIMPNQSFIEENRQKYVLTERILPFLDQYLGSIFERVSIDFLKQINGTNRFPFVFEKIGRYWKTNVEIDIVAFDSSKKDFFFAECKWSEKKVGTNILDELIAKSKTIIDENKPKKVFYGLFSKSGFTDNLKKTNRDDVLLFQLKDFREFC